MFHLGNENAINLQADIHSGSNLLERNISWLKQLSQIVFFKIKTFVDNDDDDDDEGFNDLNHVTFVIEDNDDETDIVINDFNYVTFAYDDKLMKKRKIAMNVGKYLVSEETEEIPEKTTCKGNQP